MVYYYMTLVVSFILGACIGSFTLVVVRRGYNGVEWVSGRSVCESCGKQLSWYELMPIVSFLALGGKCKGCKTPIDSSHFVAELLSGLVTLTCVLIYFNNTQQYYGAITMFVVLIVMAMVSMGDLAYKMIDTIPVYVAAVIGAIANGWIAVAVTIALITASIIIFRQDNFKSFGSGDVDLLILAIAITWSITGLITVVVTAAILGIIMYFVAFKKNEDKAIPMAPCFLFGTMLWYCGVDLINFM